MALKSWLKKLMDPQGYSLAVAVALLLHVLVISLFTIEWPEEKRQVAEPKPKNIQAKVIQVENKQVKQRKLAEKKRAEQRRKDALRKKQLAQKKAAEKKAAQKKAAKDKAIKDQLAKEKAKKLALKKERLSQQKKEQLKKEQERKEQQQREEQLAFEQAQETALLEAVAQEEQQRSMEKALAEEQRARENAAITDDVVAQIQAKIYQTWRYPPSARPNMVVMVSIQLVPTGEVINVSITKSSGNKAIDRSVLAAVKKAAPLPVPKDNRLFEQKFRNFSMEFSPKDAVW